MAKLFLETSDNLQKTHEAILRSLSILGYKIQVDNQIRIIANHPTSFSQNLFAHTIEIEFSSMPEKVDLSLNIDHKAGGIYLEKLYTKMTEILPTIRTSYERGPDRRDATTGPKPQSYSQ